MSVPLAILRICTALTYVVMQSGMSLRGISVSTGISRATLRDWREHPEIGVSLSATCPRCAANPTLPEPQADYAYLLGLYLGDGCISLAGARAKKVWKLRIACAGAWPGLRRECERATRSVRPGTRSGLNSTLAALKWRAALGIGRVFSRSMGGPEAHA